MPRTGRGRGRPRKPTQLKIIEGNRGKRPINRHEPEPDKKAPECPEHLDAQARKHWERISAKLLELGVLTVVDGASLAAYCQSYSRWIAAEDHLKKESMIYKTDKGYPVLNPWLGVANKAMEQMKSFMIEFGLTPASRTRLAIKPPDDKAADPADSYF